MLFLKLLYYIKYIYLSYIFNKYFSLFQNYFNQKPIIIIIDKIKTYFNWFLKYINNLIMSGIFLFILINYNIFFSYQNYFFQILQYI